MSGFVASPPPPDPASADAIEADGWFPAISLSDTRDSIRVGQETTDARLRDAILAGMTAAIADLWVWRDAQMAGSLADVADLDVRGNARTLGGQARLVQLWRRAVTSYAAADVLETHRTVAATIDGRQRSDDALVTADDHRRNALAAVRDMLGITRTRVVLL